VCQAVLQLTVTFSGCKSSTPTLTAEHRAAGKPYTKALLPQSHYQTLPARSLQLLPSAICAECCLLFCVFQQVRAKLQGKLDKKLQFLNRVGCTLR